MAGHVRSVNKIVHKFKIDEDWKYPEKIKKGMISAKKSYKKV